MSSATAPEHLLVVSDMHLTQEAPARGLWKRFLQRDRFVDGDFAAWLERMRADIGGPICLVLNGDIFDFDAVMAVPQNARDLSYLERTRSLHPTQEKSAFKMERIITDHPVFFDALEAFLTEGHRVVVVLGNHDLELFWPTVQARLRDRLGPHATAAALCFEPWFYRHGDVRIEHGHLLDPWSSVDDPRCPLVRSPEGEERVQIPFGNMAGRYLINRMGYFNPNCSDSYQRSLWGYLVFWVRHHLFAFRPLVTAWIAGACYTLLHALRLRRAHPARPRLRLPAPYAAPVYRRWFLMVREFWFDRLALAGLGLLVVAILTGALGPGWWLLPALAGVVVVTTLWDRIVRRFVARSDAWLEQIHETAVSLARAAKARILILGHTHGWRKERLPGGGFYLNSGNFSPSYHDLECEQPVPHSRTFLWLPPGQEPQVLEWRNGAPVRLS